MTTAADHASRQDVRRIFSKVPEVTIYFWIIKILATTIGETAADFLNDTLHFGLTWTTVAMTGVLAVALYLQFRERRYVPGYYWFAVVAISVVGTLITDNLTDRFGVSLKLSTALFALALAVTFGVWQRKEGTLSIHSIFTARREAYYWLAILFTFALGTAAGDLIAEQFKIGYWRSALIFGAGIALITLAWRYLRLNAILAFWAAYILTRPLGASIGDYLSQSRHAGGLALGTTGTSAIFLAAILAVVVYLTRTRKDQIVIEAGDR
ncbi:MAG: hypothetical protein QOK43_2163 [Acidimicrobiaceae bacterium]|nr:hypothetical protein [Acidimicrobiaceae bacterium]